MAKWKVFADKIKLFPHPTADKLQLGRVGNYQVVVPKKVEFKDGDIVVFAPARSVLPLQLRQYYTSPKGVSYLGGQHQDRVLSRKFIGEVSEGVILPTTYVEFILGCGLSFLPLGEDLSDKLLIRAHRHNVRGAQPLGDVSTHGNYHTHDVEQFRIFEEYFLPTDNVCVTEKIHGEQIVISRDRQGRITVSTKGLSEKGYVLVRFSLYTESRSIKCLHWLTYRFASKIWHRSSHMTENPYWRAADRSGILSQFKKWPSIGSDVQIFGEVIPSHRGFNYGKTSPVVLIFRLEIEGKSYGWGSFFSGWVPLLYSGPYDLAKISPLREGMEQVSGKELHIREGIVLEHSSMRRAPSGTPIIVKLLNPEFKDEEIV